MMLLLIVIAISLDSLLVAFAYGLKKLSLPLLEVLKISVTVGIVFGISLVMGSVLSSFISIHLTEMIGGIVLIGVGLSLILTQLFEKKQQAPFLIQLLKKPLKADLDKSWSINGTEAYLIGIALSLDSIGAGIGVSILGISPALASVVVIIVTILFLMLGIHLGKYCANIRGIEKMSLLPGCLLLLIGLWKIIW